MTSLQEILAVLDRGVTVQIIPGSRAHGFLKDLNQLRMAANELWNNRRTSTIEAELVTVLRDEYMEPVWKVMAKMYLWHPSWEDEVYPYRRWLRKGDENA